MKLISISTASQILGVTQKTLRLWEKEGKITPVYTPNGHRRYDLNYINNFYNVNSKKYEA